MPRAADRVSKHNVSKQDVRRCPDAALGCPPGEAECAESNSGCAGTSDDATTPVGDARRRRMLRHEDRAMPLDVANHSTAVGCRPGLTGIYCKKCAPHAERVFYYPATSNRPASCRICYNMAVHNILIVLGIAAGVALVALALWAVHSRLPETRRLQLAYAWHKCTCDIARAICEICPPACRHTCR